MPATRVKSAGVAPKCAPSPLALPHRQAQPAGASPRARWLVRRSCGCSIFSLELEGFPLASNALADSKPSPSVKSNPSPGASSPSTGQMSPAMTTCEPSLPIGLLPMELPLTSSAEGSHAKTSLALESARELEKELAAGFTLRSSGLLATYDQPSSSWRTSQACLVALLSNQGAGLALFSETWPRSGLMLNGKSYQRRPLVPYTSESAYGLLPTPTKTDCVDRKPSERMVKTRNGTFRHINKQGSQSCVRFGQIVKHIFLPTLGKNEPKGASRNRYRGSEHFRGAKMSEGLRTCEDDPIYLHPSFAEAAMGFPIGWTELDAAETP